MRTSDQAPVGRDRTIGPMRPREGDHDDRLSVRRPSANRGNPGRGFGLSPFGFLIAGMLGILVPSRCLTRLVGTGKIVRARDRSSAPLYPCVLRRPPTALGLRRQGHLGATVAFLIATPETGVDSVSPTYALADPVMTVFRPIAGVATAIASGLATNLFGGWRLSRGRRSPRLQPQRRRGMSAHRRPCRS
jgi:hypothetical protein